MLLALLLVTRTAADWVEISQQHYRKPVRLTTTIDGTTRQTYQDVQPTRNTYQVLQTPTRDYHNQNAQNPTGHKYQDVQQGPTRSTYLSHDVFLQKPVGDDFRSHNGSPQNSIRKNYFDEEAQPVRINPFMDDNMSLQSPVRNTSPTRDTYLNKRLESGIKETYPNHSFTEHNWNQNMDRPGNGYGDAKVTIARNENTYRVNGERIDKPGERKKLNVEDNVRNTVRVKDETVSGKVERVSNIGSIKRVQLANTPVKSPALNAKFSERTPDRRYDNFNDVLDIETDIFNSHEHAASKNPSNIFKQDLSSVEEIQITHVDYVKTNVSKDETKSPITSLQRHSFKRKPDVTDKVSNIIQGNSSLKQNSVPENVEPTVEHKVVNINSAANKPATPKAEFTANKDTKLPDFVTQKTFIESTKEEVQMNIENVESPNKNRGSVKFENIHRVDDKESSPENGENINSSSGEIKVNTMENILKFMKVVADTISKNTRRGANGKITYLNELKHTLLTNIKERIDTAWPDDDNGSGSRRRSRSASPRGHVEFPSSESALMTISFLTFAVFLIKLVLQVIQTYKHKSMIMAPLMVATAKHAVGKKLRGN